MRIYKLKIYKQNDTWYKERDFKGRYYEPHQVICGKGWFTLLKALWKYCR